MRRSRPSLTARSALLALSFVAAGVLSLFSPDASAIGILVPTTGLQNNVNLVYHRVEVDITERGAQTHVIQEFENKTGRQLEATYIFPMPKDATVDEYALWMNGRKEVGKVMERKEARRIYESIVRRRADPGLIEYIDGKLFQARVFPVPANGRMKIELTYSNLVDYSGGLHEYVYPLKTDAHASSTLEDFTMTVRIHNKLPIRNIYSPTHRVAAKKKANIAFASFEKSAFSLADDFRLFWSVDDKDVGVTVLSYKEPGKAGYFMLLASPNDGIRDKEIIGKRVSFVVDTSGSMMGEKMDATKKALDYCLSQLGEDDLFNVITYGGYVEQYSERMVAASSANKRKARSFVKEIEPLGGTNIDEALEATFKGVSGNRKAPHLVVFISDGRPTVGETNIKTLLTRTKEQNKDAARIFVFGVGDDVNTILLDKLAGESGGHATYLSADATLTEDVKAFYDRVSHPVFSNISLDIPKVRAFGEHPRKNLPDLFRGGQLVMLGRYRNPGDTTVTLTGETSNGKRTFKYPATFTKDSTEHSFVPRLWAQRQVGKLLAEIRLKGESKGLVDEVTQLATAFGIVTPYTSYLVVEPGANTIRRRTRPRPAPPPTARPLGTTGGPGLGGFGRGSGGGGAFDGAPAEAPMDDFDFEETASEPAAEGAPAKGMRARVAKTKAKKRDKRFKAESGADAVATSKDIGRLQRSESKEREVLTTVQRALGRQFHFRGGFFVDEKVKARDKTLQIRPFSDAFFEVLRLRPDLKQALMLGEYVKIHVANGRALVVTPGAPKTIDAVKVAAFVKK